MEIGWRKRRKEREKGFKKLKPVILSLNLERYGKYKCERCGKAPLRKNESGETVSHPNTATVDHILDLSKGGGNHLENLQVLCFECNNRKSNKKAS